MPGFQSPLRYPGGKRKLANYIKLLLRSNHLLDGEYAEVYAGGAAVALELLIGKYVSRIHINDYDPSLYSFWKVVVDETDALCNLITATEPEMKEWEKQREVYAAVQRGELLGTVEAAFATFFLNRTNRSGIISGGVIGGKGQGGPWKIDARYNAKELAQRIRKIGRLRKRIEVKKMDGVDFIRDYVPTLPEKSFIYLDPPYYVKGQQMLYANYYRPGDHAEVARLVGGLQRPWMVSYDAEKEIKELYSDFSSRDYDISYSAQDRYRGREVAFFSPGLVIPEADDPARLKDRDLRQMELELLS